jgi:23S rRNA pseudouridine2605 synthase
VHLPRNLKVGRWIELEKEVIDEMAHSVGASLKKRTGLYGRSKMRAERSNEKQAKRGGYLRRRHY